MAEMLFKVPLGFSLYIWVATQLVFAGTLRNIAPLAPPMQPGKAQQPDIDCATAKGGFTQSSSKLDTVGAPNATINLSN